MFQPIPNSFATQIGTDMFASPSLEAIQTLRNRVTYGALAGEYGDPAHATIADFHRLTTQILSRLTKEIRAAMAPVSSGEWLVAGVGTGANVADFLAASGAQPGRLAAADVSPEMLAQAARSNVSYDELSELDLTLECGKGAGHFHAILALLADPYLDERGFRSLASRLHPGGRLLITVPSRRWANLVRQGQDPDEAWFNLLDGQRLSAPSFCWNVNELAALGAHAGTRPLITASAMHDDDELTSVIIREAAIRAKPERLAVVSLALFVRD